jgi:hypothetical protein
MKNKNSMIIGFVFVAIIGVAVFLYFKGKSSTGTETTGTASLFPTISEIMAKGYDQKEAEQILDGLTAGRITTY